MNETNQMGVSPCDYVSHVRDNHPKRLTREIFESFLNDFNVAFLCEKVREHTPQAETYKQNLPALTWQSHFDGQLRADKNAVPTGLFCLDIDIHHEEEFKERGKKEGWDKAFEWAENEAHERAARWAAMAKREDEVAPDPGKELGIVAIHISPSGTGLHVVAVCNWTCKSIEENQKRLASLLETSFDPVCKDWARVFFIVPRKDWFYIDYDNLFAVD